MICRKNFSKMFVFSSMLKNRIPRFLTFGKKNKEGMIVLDSSKKKLSQNNSNKNLNSDNWFVDTQ